MGGAPKIPPPEPLPKPPEPIAPFSSYSAEEEKARRKSRATRTSLVIPKSGENVGAYTPPQNQ